MTDFGEEFDDRADSPFEWSSAHEILNAYSRAGTPEIPHHSGMSVELAAMKILADSAEDTYELVPEVLSNTGGVAPLGGKDGALARPTITIAGVSMGRHDIAKKGARGAERSWPFIFKDEDAFCVMRPNTGSNPGYIRADWEQMRLDKIRECVDAGANMICLGEYDFTPHSDSERETDFTNEISKIIDGQGRPILVVAGSRHEPRTVQRPSGAAYVEWHNVARIVCSDELCNNPNQPCKEFLHDKLVSATKAGEIIARPSEIDVKYYDTVLGRIAVLICVDAYDPTVILSLINPELNRHSSKRGNKNNSLDFVLVPAYNYSPKLYYSCQVLSMIAQCTVLLVDTCNHFSENPRAENLKTECTELFICGRTFSDIRDSKEPKDQGVGEWEKRGDKPSGCTKIWKASQNYLKAAPRLQRDQNPLPLLGELKSILQALSERSPDQR